jgi:hypothetical protein
MRRIPPSNIATRLVLLGLLACGPGDGSEADPGASPQIPFGDRPLAEGEFTLVSAAGDTLRFAVVSSRRDLRLARYHRANTGLDSLVAILDPRSYAPVSSFQRGLAALDFEANRVVSFNFVAAFNQRAIPARLEIETPRLIGHRGERVRAYPVHLRVSGLEERYWFAADPPHNLLRIEELTRQITWSRPCTPRAGSRSRC